VKYLLELGVNINKKHISYLLFRACENGHINILKCLEENGANIHTVNNDGETPLFKACQNWHKDVGKYLVELGADLNKINKKGETPLYR